MNSRLSTEVCVSLRGLVLWLRKKGYYYGNDGMQEMNPGDNCYKLWGYYDFLVIQKIVKWGQLRPYGLEGKDIGVKQEYCEEFPLKLIEPEDKTSESPFDYNTNHDDCPFIIAALMQLSQGAAQYFAQNDEGINSRFQKEILNSASTLWGQSSDDNLLKLNITTYYSLSYCDAVILMKTERLDLATDLLANLKYCKVASKDMENPFLISSDYIIVGYKPDYPWGQAYEWDGLDQISFSIRLILRPGVTAERFYYFLLEKLESEKQNDTMLKSRLLTYIKAAKNGNPNNFYFRTYGNSDALLVFQRDLPALFAEYTDKAGFLNFDSEFYQNFIVSTRSTICRNPFDSTIDQIEELGEALTKPHPCKIAFQMELKNRWVEVERCFSNYQNTLIECLSGSHSDDQRQNERIKTRFLRVLQIYNDLALSDHIFEIRCMFEPIFDATVYNIDKATEKIKTQINGYDDADTARRAILHTVDNTNQNIEFLRNTMIELLTDFLHAERQAIQGRNFVHQAVGSASKLLFAYHSFLRLMTRIVYEQPEKPSEKFCFLISCGGVTQTEARVLFSNLTDRYLDNQGVNITATVILLTESTLYQPGVAVFKLAHELFHVIGNHALKRRAESIFLTLGRYLAYYLGEYYNIDENQWTQVFAGITSDKKGYLPEIRKAAEAFIAGRRDTLSDDLIKKLEEHYDEYPIPDNYLYSGHLSNYLSNRLASVFDGKEGDRSLLLEISRQMAQDRAAMWKLVVNRLLNIGVYPLQAVLLEQTVVSEDVSALILNAMRGADAVQANEYELRYPDFPDVNIAIGTFITIFREVFADISACTYLGASAGEYLFMFMHEQAMPVEALPLTLEVVIRFGAVLYQMDSDFKECVSVESDTISNKKIDEKIARITSELYKLWGADDSNQIKVKPLKALINKYAEHIKKLIAGYRKYYHLSGITKPLYEYINTMNIEYQRHIDNSTGEIEERLQTIRGLFRDGLFMDNEQSASNAYGILRKLWLNSAREGSGSDASAIEG